MKGWKYTGELLERRVGEGGWEDVEGEEGGDGSQQVMDKEQKRKKKKKKKRGVD